MDVITEPAYVALDVLEQVTINPADRNAMKKSLYKRKISRRKNVLKNNRFYISQDNMCKTPSYPSIPETPKWACTSENIDKHKAYCTLTGVSEYACGEFIEGKMEKTGRAIYSGVGAAAGCTGVISLLSSGKISLEEVAAAGLIGGVDNVGEQLWNQGGLAAGAGLIVRGAAALGKVSLVAACQKRVELACNPEPIHRQISSMKIEHDQCQRDLIEFNRIL